MPKYYVFLVNQTGKDDSVIANLREITSVKQALGAFGPYDVIVKLESPDETIEYDISHKIRKIPHIRSTVTLRVQKEGFRKTNQTENKVLEKHSAQAYTLLRCNESNESEIMDNLKNIPDVIEADVLLGSFDIIARIVAPTYNEISSIVSNRIRKMKNIKSTTTLFAINQGFQR